MTSATSSMKLAARAALAVLACAACAGAPGQQPTPVASVPAPAEADHADGGASRPAPAAEPAPAPEQAAAPPQPLQPIASPDEPPTPATPIADTAPILTCERIRALKSAPPKFERPPLPCDRADRLLYYRGGAGGACGLSAALTVEATGAATLDTIASGGARPAGTTCPGPQTARIDLVQVDARRLVASSCEAFNDGYSLEGGIGCRTAAVRLFFFEGESKLGETAALPCPPHALDRVVAELEAIAAKFD